MNRGNINKMRVKVTNELRHVLDEFGFQYNVINLYSKEEFEYCQVYGNRFDYHDVMYEWKRLRWPKEHLTVCNVGIDGSFCIGVVDNWDELDSYARHYILMMEA